MKNLIFIITLFFGVTIYAQNEFKDPKVFVRMYNLQGKKIAKGKVLKLTDTTLVLKRNKEFVTIPVSSIGSIKTKRSAGSNILIGTAVGTTIGAILISSVAGEDDSLESALAVVGATAFVAIGAGIGGITTLFKNSKLHEINGDKLRWKVFREAITEQKQ